jgi:hypothetical protein
MLFTNDVAVDGELSATENALVEATGSNYSRVIVYREGGSGSANWRFTVGSDVAYPTGVAMAELEPITFPATGKTAGSFTTALSGGTGRDTVYGYAVLREGTAASNATTGVMTDINGIIFADRLSSPFIPAPGNSLILSVKFQLSHGTPAP